MTRSECHPVCFGLPLLLTQHDVSFFYETLAPILLIDRTSLLAISTLTSEINFYSRLMKLKDSATGRPIFTILQIQVAPSLCFPVVSERG